MATVRLNLWQRLGVIASAIWILVQGVLAWRWMSYNAAVFHDCTSASMRLAAEDLAPSPPVSLPIYAPISCWTHNLPNIWRFEGAAITEIAVEVAGVWLLAYAANWAARWVWAGRGQQS